LNVKTEQKITISHVLRRDTSGPVIFNAPVYSIRDLYLSVTNPSGIIRQSRPAADQPIVISGNATKTFKHDLLRYNYSLSHALSLLSHERASKSRLSKKEDHLI
jgi:hypothetical protein